MFNLEEKQASPKKILKTDPDAQPSNEKGAFLRIIKRHVAGKESEKEKKKKPAPSIGNGFEDEIENPVQASFDRFRQTKEGFREILKEMSANIEDPKELIKEYLGMQVELKREMEQVIQEKKKELEMGRRQPQKLKGNQRKKETPSHPQNLEHQILDSVFEDEENNLREEMIVKSNPKSRSVNKSKTNRKSKRSNHSPWVNRQKGTAAKFTPSKKRSSKSPNTNRRDHSKSNVQRSGRSMYNSIVNQSLAQPSTRPDPLKSKNTVKREQENLAKTRKINEFLLRINREKQERKEKRLQKERDFVNNLQDSLAKSGHFGNIEREEKARKNKKRLEIAERIKNIEVRRRNREKSLRASNEITKELLGLDGSVSQQTVYLGPHGYRREVVIETGQFFNERPLEAQIDPKASKPKQAMKSKAKGTGTNFWMTRDFNEMKAGFNGTGFEKMKIERAIRRTGPVDRRKAKREADRKGRFYNEEYVHMKNNIRYFRDKKRLGRTGGNHMRGRGTRGLGMSRARGNNHNQSHIQETRDTGRHRDNRNDYTRNGKELPRFKNIRHFQSMDKSKHKQPSRIEEVHLPRLKSIDKSRKAAKHQNQRKGHNQTTFKRDSMKNTANNTLEARRKNTQESRNSRNNHARNRQNRMPKLELHQRQKKGMNGRDLDRKNKHRQAKISQEQTRKKGERRSTNKTKPTDNNTSSRHSQRREDGSRRTDRSRQDEQSYSQIFQKKKDQGLMDQLKLDLSKERNIVVDDEEAFDGIDLEVHNIEDVQRIIHCEETLHNKSGVCWVL